MLTLCIRYTLDANKLADFEAYARPAKPVERCGGKFVGYYLPTKIAGPTNMAIGLIDSPTSPPTRVPREAADGHGRGRCLRRADAAGCILNEDRAFVRRITD